MQAYNPAIMVEIHLFSIMVDHGLEACTYGVRMYTSLQLDMVCLDFFYGQMHIDSVCKSFCGPKQH